MRTKQFKAESKRLLGSDDQLDLHPPGDLPAGTDLQRLRRHRQAVLSGADRRTHRPQPRATLRSSSAPDKDRPHPDRQRQRHRHGRRTSWKTTSARSASSGSLALQAGRWTRTRPPTSTSSASSASGFYSAFMVARQGDRHLAAPTAPTRPGNGNPRARTATPSTPCEKDDRRHRHHPAAQGRHRRRELLPSSSKHLRAPGACAASTPITSATPSAWTMNSSRMKEGTPRGQARIRDVYRDRDAQLHGSHLEQEQEARSPTRTTTISIRRNSSTSRTRCAGHPRQHRGRGHLQRPALHPRPGALSTTTPRTIEKGLQLYA